MPHYTSHSFTIQDTADSTPTIVGSLVSVGAPIDTTVEKTQTGGSAYPEHISVTESKQRFTGTTHDVPKILSSLGLLGRRLEAASGKVGIGLNMRKIDEGIAATGSVHRQLSFPLSHARATRISVSHRADASIEFEANAISNGTDAPLLIDDTLALPTLPTAGRWTIGKLVIGGVTIGCKTQVDIDLGTQVDSFGCDSNPYDTNFNVDQIAPMITITSLDVLNFAAAKAALVGLVGIQTNSVLYLRKRVANSQSFVADATAEHIKINFAGVILPTDAFSASNNQKGQSTFKIETAFDGTNAPLVFDTASAIT